MKKSNVQITAAAVFAAMLLGGCGDEPYALSEKEEQIIVNYSAHVVGKFNKTGKEGLRLIDVEALLEEEAAAQEPEAGGDTELSSESPEGTPAAGDGSGMPVPENPVQTASLGELFGSENIKVDYVGSRLSTDYVEKEFYAMDADAGMVFLVVGIDITNVGEEPAALDFLSATPAFTAVVNGEPAVAAELTLLSNDFSTLEAEVEAKATLETVLLFQIPETITSIDTLTLEVSVNGGNYQVNLENM